MIQIIEKVVDGERIISVFNERKLDFRIKKKHAMALYQNKPMFFKTPKKTHYVLKSSVAMLLAGLSEKQIEVLLDNERIVMGGDKPVSVSQTPFTDALFDRKYGRA